jgi:hypothetical protein
MTVNRLRLDSENGSPTYDYRVREGHVELRTLDEHGRPYNWFGTDWRPLSDNEVRLHVNLHTVVGEWLMKRFTEQIPI